MHDCSMSVSASNMRISITCGPCTPLIQEHKPPPMIHNHDAEPLCPNADVQHASLAGARDAPHMVGSLDDAFSGLLDVGLIVGPNVKPVQA